jgi:murein L,D-transpeptidase YcbB/YkuD
MRQLILSIFILGCGALATPFSDTTIACSDNFGDPNRHVSAPQKMFSQYEKLSKALDRYQGFAKRGGWTIIKASDSVWRVGDRSDMIRLVRARLLAENYLDVNSKSRLFDQELLQALNTFKQTHNLIQDSVISPATIVAMNVPVSERITTINLNLERCRLVNADENGQFIAVNIPAFMLYYMNDGKPVLTSKVVVGKEVSKTVVFNDTISEIVFSPYWNVPASITNKELLPAIRKYPKLFSEMNLEWNNGKLRQKPGKNNALGLVKFVFPNSNNIYLHDTPMKSLFAAEQRTFSHGCIRVEKACELATILMRNELGWSEAQTQTAMNGEKQTVHRLKNKIPIYIAYFTAWADDNGNITFYPDIYGHDHKLSQVVSKKEMTSN